MNATLRPYWITIRTGDGRTADRRILARSDWAAWWLGCVLHGRHAVVMVRRVR